MLLKSGGRQFLGLTEANPPNAWSGLLQPAALLDQVVREPVPCLRRLPVRWVEMLQRSGHGQPGIEPISMVRIIAVAAIGYAQFQRFHALEVCIDGLGGLTAFDDAALP